MLESSLTSRTHNRTSVFQVYSRSLPAGRRYGVFAGTGRLLDLIRDFRFGQEELAWLAEHRIVGDEALELLAGYRFTGNITGYREGELYFPHSPVMTVEAPFWEAVILETLVLSVLNYDTAVAGAAARMHSQAQGRSLAEMGSRRASERSAVAAARAAYIAGFDATSNLEAGRSWGVPTMGTAAHSFTLLHDSEEDAFRAQLSALGNGTTLLVDTYDIPEAVALAVRLAGNELGAVRIDSGDLPVVVKQVREQLDSLGAHNTKITVTNDLDEYAIAGLAIAPVDSYGVGTSLVTGSGSPTAGMVYKLVARENNDGEMIPVAKRSAGKADAAGKKFAYRMLDTAGQAQREAVFSHNPTPQELTEFGGAAHRQLQVPLIINGETESGALGSAGTLAAREHRAAVIQELNAEAFRLGRGDPALPTQIID